MQYPPVKKDCVLGTTKFLNYIFRKLQHKSSYGQDNETDEKDHVLRSLIEIQPDEVSIAVRLCVNFTLRKPSLFYHCQILTSLIRARLEMSLARHIVEPLMDEHRTNNKGY